MRGKVDYREMVCGLRRDYIDGEMGEKNVLQKPSLIVIDKNILTCYCVREITGKSNFVSAQR